MGKLSDALKGLKFLCSLPNMETHADLIAGLPLYHLYEIFEDVYTLAGYNAGEIQLESLKLLPGTEMRQRAEELGIRYSPFPPYEVLETNEISVGELQTARRLSRLLDAFYNTPAWHTLTRELILNDKDFLHNLLKYLIQVNLIDQPMSLEKRGLILYEYCKLAYPEYKRGCVKTLAQPHLYFKFCYIFFWLCYFFLMHLATSCYIPIISGYK